MPFTYTTGIPATNNNPSADQPDMLNNTNSISSIWSVDHAGFDAQNAGMHNLARFLRQSGIPAGLINLSGAVYDKEDTVNLPNEDALFFSPGNTTNQYQLTRTDTNKFSTFGTNTLYLTNGGYEYTGGWTFLPGGMILQYGSIHQTVGISVTVTVKFPKDFTNNGYIAIPVARANTLCSSSVIQNSLSQTQFLLSSTGTSDWYWAALGV